MPALPLSFSQPDDLQSGAACPRGLAGVVRQQRDLEMASAAMRYGTDERLELHDL